MNAPLRLPTLLTLLALLAGLPQAASVRASLTTRCAWTTSTVAPSSTHVLAAPVVADLDGDGATEVVFLSGTVRDSEEAVLRVASAEDCTELFSVDRLPCGSCLGLATCDEYVGRTGLGAFSLATGLAVGDLDGDCLLEIVAATDDRRHLVVLDHQGRLEWCSPETTASMIQPSLADLDADGLAEVVAGLAAFSHAGDLLWEASDVPGLFGVTSVVADVDGDGAPDVVTGRAAYRTDGSVVWSRPDILAPAPPAVVDLEGDGHAEVVLGSGPFSQYVHVLEGATGETRCVLHLPDGSGGASAADVDGDGLVEILFPTHHRLFFFGVERPGGCLVPRWDVPSDDVSSGTTVAVFADRDGDGVLEVVHRDQSAVRVLDGLTGEEIDTFPLSSSTAWELPVVADVDGDGAAEVTVGADSLLAPRICCDEGLRILGDDAAPWPTARGIWNQHAYHVSNVGDDGGIPSIQGAAWEPPTSWRAQVEPQVVDLSELAATPSLLWPPNHRFVAVRFEGAVAPGGLPAAVRVVSVHQDEPLDGRGDGEFEPDAIIEADAVLLRAERSGRGDGRVYRIVVEAGSSCRPSRAAVTVCVPHDASERRDCVAGELVVDSTGGPLPP